MITRILLFVAIALLAAQYLSPSHDNVCPSGTDVVFSLSPDPVLTNQPEGTLDLRFDSGQSRITNLQIEASYDPATLEVESITPSQFFLDGGHTPGVVVNNITNGKIRFIVQVQKRDSSVADKGAKGNAVIATLKYKIINPKRLMYITVLNTSLATIEGYTPSVLKKAYGATIVYEGDIPVSTTTTPTP